MSRLRSRKVLHHRNIQASTSGNRGCGRDWVLSSQDHIQLQAWVQWHRQGGMKDPRRWNDSREHLHLHQLRLHSNLFLPTHWSEDRWNKKPTATRCWYNCGAYEPIYTAGNWLYAYKQNQNADWIKIPCQLYGKTFPVTGCRRFWNTHHRGKR